ncbi:MAG: DUF3256 family protein [Prevotella sp.]|nr:DUF3256 family protein [Prevotella sp.]
MTKSRNIFFIAVLLFFSQVSFAVSVKDAFTTMPSHIVPHLDENKRVALINLYELQSSEGSTNALDGESIIDTLTADYLLLKVSSRSVLEMKLVPMTQENVADTLICVSQTYMGECAESKLSFFTRNWQQLSDTIFKEKALLLRPDTMSEERYQQLLSQIPLVLWHVSLSVDNTMATLTPSLPLVAIEDKEKLAPLLMQRSLNLKDLIFKKF